MTSYVAQRAASKKAEGMLAPLLDSDEESSLGSDTDSDASSKVETVKQTPMQKLKSLMGTYDLFDSTFFHIGGWLYYHPLTHSHQFRFLPPMFTQSILV